MSKFKIHWDEQEIHISQGDEPVVFMFKEFEDIAADMLHYRVALLTIRDIGKEATPEEEIRALRQKYDN